MSLLQVQVGAGAKKIFFGDLNMGEVFRIKDAIFLKTNDKRLPAPAGGVAWHTNAIGLGGGSLGYHYSFVSPQEVVPMKSTLTVETE